VEADLHKIYTKTFCSEPVNGNAYERKYNAVFKDGRVLRVGVIMNKYSLTIFCLAQ
jgi:hypothetical protein